MPGPLIMNDPEEEQERRQYGIRFPSGDEQWTGYGPLEFHLPYLSLPEGRRKAQEAYQDQLARLGVYPSQKNLLTFLTRVKSTQYTAPVVITDGESDR
jgi:hypothetical protein